MDCTIEYVQKRTEDYRFSCEEMYHGRILDLILLIRSVFFFCLAFVLVAVYTSHQAKLLKHRLLYMTVI